MSTKGVHSVHPYYTRFGLGTGIINPPHQLLVCVSRQRHSNNNTQIISAMPPLHTFQWCQEMGSRDIRLANRRRTDTHPKLFQFCITCCQTCKFGEIRRNSTHQYSSCSILAHCTCHETCLRFASLSAPANYLRNRHRRTYIHSRMHSYHAANWPVPVCMHCICSEWGA